MALCCSDLSEEACEEVVNYFNNSWLEGLQRGSILHWCGPGCCASHSESKAKLRSALSHVFSHLPQIPLLYRWKGFDEAAHWAFRGCMLHGIFPLFLSQAISGPGFGENDLPPIHEDDADSAPAMRQKVRLVKTAKLFTEGAARVTCPGNKQTVLPLVQGLWHAFF